MSASPHVEIPWRRGGMHICGVLPVEAARRLNKALVAPERGTRPKDVQPSTVISGRDGDCGEIADDPAQLVSAVRRDPCFAEQHERPW